MPRFGGDAADDQALLNQSPLVGPGVAAWNDFSPSPARPRGAEKNASRIQVPRRSFVIMVLVLYLAFLVPFNWAIFARLAAWNGPGPLRPMIAIACTAVVVKLAQLDIGFVRSRTEIAVLEIQPD